MKAPRYSQLTHTTSRDGLPVTILAIEGEARDVAAYYTTGHRSADETLSVGMKLTHAAAMEKGARWPAHLSYRR